FSGHSENVWQSRLWGGQTRGLRTEEPRQTRGRAGLKSAASSRRSDQARDRFAVAGPRPRSDQAGATRDSHLLRPLRWRHHARAGRDLFDISRHVGFDVPKRPAKPPKHDLLEFGVAPHVLAM